MTGFGSTVLTHPLLDLEIMIRVVNGRYLDIKFHLPQEYLVFESEFKKIVSQKIRRGTVDIRVQKKRVDDNDNFELKVHENRVKKWNKAYQGILKTVNRKEPVPLAILLQSPQIVSWECLEKVSKKEKSILVVQLKETLKKVEQERIREGHSIEKELLNQVNKIRNLLKQMHEVQGQQNPEIIKRIKLKWQQLLSEVTIDENRFTSEIITLMDKADVNEELIRLSEHMNAFTQEIKSHYCDGKKLDFYVQELLRETNTIGSKSQNVKMTQMVVEVKTSIERMRELIQNVE